MPFLTSLNDIAPFSMYDILSPKDGDEFECFINHSNKTEERFLLALIKFFFQRLKEQRLRFADLIYNGYTLRLRIQFCTEKC